jgi:hypothetical protein
VALYRAVKKRTLPVAAMALYGAATASFEGGQFLSAAAQFKELLDLLSDPDEAGRLSDMRVLAAGFSKLTEQRLAESTDQQPRLRLRLHLRAALCRLCTWCPTAQE